MLIVLQYGGDVANPETGRTVFFMSRSRLMSLRGMPSLAMILLGLLLAALWVAGGASRGDVSGQVIVRGVSAIILVVVAFCLPRPGFKAERPVLALVSAMILLPLLQLAPLPPWIWTALPGRAPFEAAAVVAGEAQSWRPWSITPGRTMNALFSLIVPLTCLVLVATLRERERTALVGLLLCCLTASTLLGLLQLSGAGFNNPLINDTTGLVSGSFANRNHFALFLAIGCLLVPAWVFIDGRSPHLRGPVGFGLVLLFVLTALATGSRAGLALTLLALAIGIVIARRPLAAELSRVGRRAGVIAGAAAVGFLAILVLASVAAGRAASIERILAVDNATDMRTRAFPTMLTMIRDYFPAGSGLGGFDPMFRMYEPFALLKPTFFNHAHNDFLEILLDAGLPGALLLFAALLWWGSASLIAWRAGSGPQRMLPKLGSAVLLLVILASVVDYPARTPMIMAVMVIAASWLGHRGEATPRSSLPIIDQHL